MSTDDEVQQDIDDLPIALHYSDPAMQMGDTTVSRLLLYFHQYLRGPENEKIDLREFALLVYVLDTHSRNATFKLKELPCPLPTDTRRRYVGKFRAMGLLYTRPHYSADKSRGVSQSKPPIRRVEFVEWNMDPLNYNLSLVYQVWYARREEEKIRTRNPRVFYRLPDDYAKPVEIPPHLAEPVALEKFYRVNTALIAQAREMLAKIPNNSANTTAIAQPVLFSVESIGFSPRHAENARVGESPLPRHAENARVGSPDARIPRVSDSPRHAENARVLVLQTTTTTTTGDAVDINSRITQFFATAVGAESYEPTEREQNRIATLLAKGYSAENICETITRLVERERAHGKSVRALAYCLHAVEDSAKQQKPAETEVVSGTPQPSVVQETPPAATRAVMSAPTLDELAGGDAELRDLLDVIQAKNPNRVLDRADARAWQNLANDFAAFATSRDTTGIGIVMQAVLEAISANSNREGFLAPNLARRILGRWQKESNAAAKRTEELCARRESEDREERLADQAESGAPESPDHNAQTIAPQYPQTLAGIALTVGEIWHGTLSELQLQLTRATFDSWLRGTRALGWEDGNGNGNGHVAAPTLVVSVHNPYAKEWLENRLNTVVRRALVGVVGQSVEIAYVVADHITARTAAAPEETA